MESSWREATVWQYERPRNGIASIEVLVAVEASVYRTFLNHRITIKDSSRSEVEPTKLMRPNICPVNGRCREVELPKYPSLWRTDYEGAQDAGHRPIYNVGIYFLPWFFPFDIYKSWTLCWYINLLSYV